MDTDGRRFDVVAVGSWTNFDHLFRVNRLPAPGETVEITSSIADIETVTWGGCAVNNAVAAARLGARAALVSVAGRDFRDRGYEMYLVQTGVDVSGVIIVEDELSGHSFMFTDPHGETICISHLGAAQRQDAFEPSRDILRTAGVVLVNYRFDSFTLKAAQMAAAGGAYVIISGALPTAPVFAEPLLRTANLIICTHREMEQLLSLVGCEHREDLFALGLQALVLTQGSLGSVIVDPLGETAIPVAPAARVVEPVGAGDAFAAGLATGIAFQLSLPDAARLGAVVASFVVEARGAQTRLPSFAQAAERYLTAFGRPLDSAKRPGAAPA